MFCVDLYVHVCICVCACVHVITFRARCIESCLLAGYCGCSLVFIISIIMVVVVCVCVCVCTFCNITSCSPSTDPEAKIYDSALHLPCHINSAITHRHMYTQAVAYLTHPTADTHTHTHSCTITACIRPYTHVWCIMAWRKYWFYFQYTSEALAHGCGYLLFSPPVKLGTQQNIKV